MRAPVHESTGVVNVHGFADGDVVPLTIFGRAEIDAVAARRQDDAPGTATWTTLSEADAYYYSQGITGPATFQSPVAASTKDSVARCCSLSASAGLSGGASCTTEMTLSP